VLSPEKARLPIIVGEFVNAYALARRGVNELPLAKVDAAVRCALFVGLEEDKVAGHEFLRTLGAQTEFVLFICGARDRDTLLLKDILEVARAVKSLRGSPAKDIGCAHICLCRLDEILHLVCGQDRCPIRCEWNFFAMKFTA